VRRIARDLNVRYVLTGAIQREGDQFRVSALLQDGETGASLWSNRWDRPSGDIFAVQNEVSDGVISTLGGRGLLTNLAAAAARRKGPSDLEAYDLFALGMADFNKGGEKGFAESIKFFDAAIAKNPQFGFAYVKKGWAILNYALSASPNGDVDKAANEFEWLSRKAIEIDPYGAEGHVSLGDKLIWWGDLAQGAVEVERALELNPSSADIMALSAGAMSHLGRPEQGAAQCDKAYCLNSAPPPWYPAFCYENYLFTKRYQESAEATKRHYAWQRPRKEDLTALVFRAAAQIEAGAADDAAATIAEWKQEYPQVPGRSVHEFLHRLFSPAGGRPTRRLPAEGRRADVRSQREACRLPEAPGHENLRRRARQASSPIISRAAQRRHRGQRWLLSSMNMQIASNSHV
jgi:tetratricopeptide (TPR) repeat protein